LQVDDCSNDLLEKTNANTAIMEGYNSFLTLNTLINQVDLVEAI